MRTRRNYLTLLGAGTVALAGCGGNSSDSAESIPTVSESPDNSSVNPSNDEYADTPTNGINEELLEPDLTGREIYFNQIHGEDEQILKEVQGTSDEHSISFQAIEQSLEEGFQNGGRNQAIAQGLQTASQEYKPGTNQTYWERHQHILSALHQTLEQKEGEQWDFKIDSRLDAQPSTDGWLKYSHIDVETEGETERGNTQYNTIRATLTEEYNHTTHIKGNPADADNYIKRILQQVDNPESHYSRSLIDKDAIDNAIEEEGWDEDLAYDQSGAQVGILLGEGIELDAYDESYVAPENLLISKDGREQQILEVVDEYEESGDLALRQRMREEYFNSGHDEYEASEVDITADGSVSMEQIDDFDMSDEIAGA